jgi:CBS domain containing-hemolysin-like protein
MNRVRRLRLRNPKPPDKAAGGVVTLLLRRYNQAPVDIAWRILATLGLVAVNAYFVAAEFSAVGARASRLQVDAETHLLSRLALRIKQRLDLYLSSCQLGVTLASLGLGAVTEPALAAVLRPLMSALHVPAHDEYVIGFIAALAVSTSLHIVIGEQAPKNWAIRYSNHMLPLIAGPLVVFTFLCYPAIWLLNAATNGVLRLTGVKTSLGGGEGQLPHTERELRALLGQAVAAGTIAGGSGNILTQAFEFGELKVRQIMTPRTRVDYLTLDQPIGEVLRTVQKSAYTRVPLCDGDIDHVVGLIHMKDLFNHLKLVPGKLRFSDAKTPDGQAIAIADGLPGSAVHVIGAGDIDLRKIKREVLFVPELLPVPKLLRQFQTKQMHLAVVVDEYGATLGIVTMEDVLEEIVGEIEDEFDTAAPKPFVKEGESFRVNGQYPLHELRERLVLPRDLDIGDVDTIGGYVIRQLKRWPRIGDSVEMGSYSVQVTAAQQRRVQQVFITPLTQQTAREDGAGKA